MDGDATAVVKAYEESIRAQEERRLRLKKQAQLGPRATASRDPGPAHVLLEIQARDGRPQPSPVYFGGISLIVGGRVVAQLPLGETRLRPIPPARTWSGRTGAGASPRSGRDARRGRC